MDHIEEFSDSLKKSSRINYLALFSKKIEQMQKNKNFQRIHFKPNPPVEIAVLNRFKQDLGFELPKSMLAFYSSMNGFELDWSYKHKKESISGGILMLPVEEAMGGPEGIHRKKWDDNTFKNILWFPNYGRKEKEFLKQLQRIEMIEGVSLEIVIKFSEVDKEPELFLWDKGDVYPLKVDFITYIELLMETMGTGYWQYLLLGEDVIEDLNISLPYYDQILTVFPDAKIDRLYDPKYKRK